MKERALRLISVRLGARFIFLKCPDSFAVLRIKIAIQCSPAALSTGSSCWKRRRNSVGEMPMICVNTREK